MTKGHIQSLTMYYPDNKPLVTVGITSFNRPKWLYQTLSSVKNQTYSNLEIFVCDDASFLPEVDQTINSFIKIASNIKYLNHYKRKGPITNLNQILEKSNGKYFIWLCDDDWIDSTYIEKCVSFMENNPDYSLTVGKTNFYVGDSFLFEGCRINIEEDDRLRRIFSFYKQALGTANSPNFGVIRKELLLKVNLRNIAGHDNILVSNLAYMGKIKTLETTHINRRLGGASETLQKLSKIYSYSKFEQKLPYLSLCINIIKDIIINSNIYNRSSFSSRCFLALKLLVDILLNLKKYFTRYKMRMIDTLEKKYLFLESQMNNIEKVENNEPIYISCNSTLQ